MLDDLAMGTTAILPWANFTKLSKISYMALESSFCIQHR